MELGKIHPILNTNCSWEATQCNLHQADLSVTTVPCSWQSWIIGFFVAGTEATQVAELRCGNRRCSRWSLCALFCALWVSPWSLPFRFVYPFQVKAPS